MFSTISSFFQHCSKGISFKDASTIAKISDGLLLADVAEEAKELEASLWNSTVDEKHLKQLTQDFIMRQNVIYELIKTELHHVRILRIISKVYRRGLPKEVMMSTPLLLTEVMMRLFPMLDDLLEIHTFFLYSLLKKRRGAQRKSTDGVVIINRIGDVVLEQFSGPKGKRMEQIYKTFCSRHREAVDFYKELLGKNKSLRTFIRKTQSRGVQLGIPECLLAVSLRITQYPLLIQKILHHSERNEEDYVDLIYALRLVEDIISAVDSKVNSHENQARLKEFYSRTDDKSIIYMQTFAREDLIRGRRLLHDGPLRLKTSVGKLKDVQALLLSDVLVFLQKKNKKYIFASMDQHSAVIPLHAMVVRAMAGEPRGLFLLMTGLDPPDLLEVHARTQAERDLWVNLLHNVTHTYTAILPADP